MRRQPYRRGGRYRDSGPRNSNAMTWILATLSILIAGGTAGWYGWNRYATVQTDAASLCPVQGPVAVHAMLLDRSDPITPLQAQRIRQVVDRMVADAAVGERIDLYVFAPDAASALTPRLSLCRPKSDGSVWNENPERIHQRFVAKFKAPLDQALSELIAPSAEKSSPIMESVKAACVSAFGSLARGTPARMTIASDMVQNSPLLDHYKQRDFDAFSRTPAFNEVLTDCHRASVDIIYLVRPRDARVQDRRHQLFWEQFFDRLNASLDRLEAI